MADLFEYSFEAVDIKKYLLEDGITHKRIYVKHIIQQYGRFIIKMNKENKLNFFGNIDEFKAIASLSAKHFEVNEVAQKTIIYIVNILEIIKNQIEKSRVDEHRENYEELKRYFNYLGSLLGNSSESQKLKSRLKSIVASFKKVKPQKGIGPGW